MSAAHTLTSTGSPTDAETGSDHGEADPDAGNNSASAATSPARAWSALFPVPIKMSPLAPYDGSMKDCVAIAPTPLSAPLRAEGVGPVSVFFAPGSLGLPEPGRVLCVPPCSLGAQPNGGIMPGRNRLMTLLAAAALSLIAVGAGAQTYLDLEGQVQEFTLDNGVHFIVLENHDVPVFSFRTFVNVGSANEVRGVTGLSHILEHMAFKGTKEIGTENYKQEVKLMAAEDEETGELVELLPPDPVGDRFRFESALRGKALAGADEQDVLAAWEGLGYYRRARSLHRAARTIVADSECRLPADLEGWRALPAVGHYAAGAIARPESVTSSTTAVAQAAALAPLSRA